MTTLDRCSHTVRINIQVEWDDFDDIALLFTFIGELEEWLESQETWPATIFSRYPFLT